MVPAPNLVVSLPGDPIPFFAMRKPRVLRYCWRSFTSGPVEPSLRVLVNVYLGVVVAVVVVADALVVKSAITRVVVVAVKEQSPLPIHAPPDQPVKVEVVAAAAVRLTELPAVTFS